MGLFDRIFGGDPRRDLERAAASLSRGDAARALELARKAARSSSPIERGRAASLISQAAEALVSQILAKAATAESSGHYEDAAEWVRGALRHVAEDSRRADLKGRIDSLLQRAEMRRAEEEAASAYDVTVPEPEEPTAGIALEDHFLALLGMLQEEVGDLYEAQPAEFRQAFVDLNEGRTEDAGRILDELVARRPDDPVTRFERGRCRLFAGDPAGARADFEAVWDSWGDGHLDLAGEVSLPSLWAEATLAAGQPGPVLARLPELADPDRGRPDVAHPYAVALMQAERLEEARAFLIAASSRFPSQEFPYLLAGVLARLDQRRQAIDCLEAAVTPSCAGGACAKPPKHLPSFRLLAELYLAEDGAVPRVGELLTHLAQAQGGRLEPADEDLLERYRKG